MHRLLTRSATALLLTALSALPLAGCGSSGSSSGASGASSSASSSRPLHLAFTEDPSPLDPDTYYQAEGLVITTSAYEGLLHYAPDSPKLEGQLATSWKVTPDGKTYTFTLRQGVRFSDGTPFNAQAALSSFKRRIALKGGPSYMLEHVSSMSTPGPYTLVVHLARPVAPFLDYMASPYGPLMSSPTAERLHAVKNDSGSGWLAINTAGTGPYVLSKVHRGSLYELTANPYYYSTPAHFKSVQISIVPSYETQRLELEGGTLDMVTDGLLPQDIKALEGNPSVQVQEFPALFKAAVWVNPKSSVFSSPTVRAALRASLSNEQITKQVYGNQGSTSTQVYPKGMLPEGAAPDEPAYDPSKLAPALSAYRGRKVVIGWYASGAMHQLANLLQVRLQALGLNATTRAYTPSVLFALPTDAKQRPDLLTTSFNPDAAAPDTFARIYWRAGAPVNLMACSVPKADHLLDQASEQASAAASEKLGAQAAIAYKESNCWLNVSDSHDTTVFRKGITGFVHELPWVLDVRLASLREG